MTDDCLVDLINKRFDDQNQLIGQLKLDMLREISALKEETKKYEDECAEGIAHLSTRIDKYDRLTWMASGATIVVVGLMKLAEHFFK